MQHFVEVLWHRLRFWTELGMIHVTGGERFCHLLQYLIPSLPPLRGKKFNYICIWSFKWQSWVRWRTAKRDKWRERGEDFAIWMFLDFSLRQHGKLCRTTLRFQMLHRLVPSLYNSYVMHADGPDASRAFGNKRGHARSHLQLLELQTHMEKMERKQQPLIKTKVITRTKGQSAACTCVYMDK